MPNKTLFAQDASFWDSGKSELSDSIGELGRILDKYGCDAAGTMKRKVDGKTHLIVEFALNDRRFAIEFKPLKVDYGRGRRTEAQLDELAEWQMGRIAVHWLKSMLTMVESGHDEVLMPYLYLRDGNSATTMQQQGMKWLDKQAVPALPAPGGRDAT